MATTAAAFTYAPYRPQVASPIAEILGEATAAREDVTVIMTADPGHMVGLSERQILMDALDGNVWQETRNLYCDKVLHGRLFGQHVLLVTTGIGHDHASVCMSDIIRVFNDPVEDGPGTVIRDIFFLGTAGFSPRRGGILNPDDCSEAQGGGPSDDGLVAIGDVCVSPFSTNWDCQKCEWMDSEQSPSACQRASCSKHGKESLFGNFVCDFYTSNTALADEVLAAAPSVQWPQRPEELEGPERLFWHEMSSGTGRAYGDGPGAVRPNKAIGYDTCSEATANTFWAGAPYDELGRQYIADLNNRVRAQKGDDGGPNQTAADTIGVSAMEGTGWMSVLMLREFYMNRPAIPFVNIRGAADYTHQPVMRDETGRWVHNMDFIPDEAARAANLAWGYRHAINTTSTLMLNVLRLRHEAASQD